MSCLGDFDVSIKGEAIATIRNTVQVFLDGLKDHGPIYDSEVVAIPDQPGCFEIRRTLPYPELFYDIQLSPETTGKMPAGVKMSRRSRRRWRGKGSAWNSLVRSLL